MPVKIESSNFKREENEVKTKLLNFRMITVFAISGLATLMSFSAAADTMNMDQKKYAAFKSFADKRLRETKVPGFGLGIIKDGEGNLRGWIRNARLEYRCPHKLSNRVSDWLCDQSFYDRYNWRCLIKTAS